MAIGALRTEDELRRFIENVLDGDALSAKFRAFRDRIKEGTGSPAGVVTGVPGDLYINKSGGATTTLYVKESGTNTTGGWVAK